jgi:hypothetical protein
MAIMIFDGTQPAQSRIRYGRSLTVRSVFSFISLRSTAAADEKKKRNGIEEEEEEY